MLNELPVAWKITMHPEIFPSTLLQIDCYLTWCRSDLNTLLMRQQGLQESISSGTEAWEQAYLQSHRITSVQVCSVTEASEQGDLQSTHITAIQGSTKGDNLWDGSVFQVPSHSWSHATAARPADIRPTVSACTHHHILHLRGCGNSEWGLAGTPRVGGGGWGGDGKGLSWQ